MTSQSDAANQARRQQAIDELESFLRKFSDYAREIYAGRASSARANFEADLRKLEPGITHKIVGILGNGILSVSGPFGPRPAAIRYSDFIGMALLGGNNALPHNFAEFEPGVKALLEKAIGTVQAGLWPPELESPKLTIRDTILRSRCSDLLAAPGYYDRVVMEATTVLEDRMRQKPPFDLLSRLIPNSGDQVGENLVNKLFAPDNPVVSISADKTKRIAFHKILVGAFAYLRNQSHHALDDQTDWSWAWSTVGFIDRLLADIDSCTVSPPRSPPGQ